MSGQVVAVVSRKGGVGKSMLTAALGVRWAAKGKRVVLVDMSNGMRCLDMLLGLESRIAFDLGDVVEGVCGLDKALITDKSTGVQLLAARQIGEIYPLNERTLQILMEVLCLQNDYVLIDTPCGIAPEQMAAARLAETVLLVSTPDDLSLRNAEALAGQIRSLKKTPFLVINRINRQYVDVELQYSPETCAEVLDLPLLGVIPQDDAAERSALAQVASLEGSSAASAIDNLMQRLEDSSIALAPWHTGERRTPATIAPTPAQPDDSPEMDSSPQPPPPEIGGFSEPPPQLPPDSVLLPNGDIWPPQTTARKRRFLAWLRKDR